MIKINGTTFGSEQFSNGEVSYKPVEVYPKNTIECFFQDNKDITDLIFAEKFIRDQIPDAIIDLEMLYVPYGRMDRPINGYVFSLKYFADLINSLHFHSVITLDNHSIETSKLIKNLGEINLNPFIYEVMHRFQPDVLFFPDKGAMKKYPGKLDIIIHNQIPYFYGEKQRILDDSREIISYELYTNGIEIKDKRILIIDDICCTGGTVLKAAEAMKRKGAKEIALWVAHCENNVIKYDIVRDGSPIKKIYTSESIIRTYHIKELEVISL